MRPAFPGSTILGLRRLWGVVFAPGQRGGRVAGLVFVLAMAVGCGRQATPPAAADPAQAAPVVDQAFAGADDALREEATAAVTALQQDQPAEAFVRLESLQSRPELTPAQREAAFQAWMAANARLQSEASNGNPGAQELLNRYRATK
jgi:hypothetical protein